MNNKPTLFVNSISVDLNGRENQYVYDSRRNVKGKIFHRLDDILSLISLGRKVFVIINYENVLFYGEVISVKNNCVFLKNNDIVSSLIINKIKEIKIV